MYSIKTMPQDMFDAWMHELEFPRKKPIRSHYETLTSYCALGALQVSVNGPNMGHTCWNFANVKLRKYVVRLNDDHKLSFEAIRVKLLANRARATRKKD